MGTAELFDVSKEISGIKWILPENGSVIISNWSKSWWKALRIILVLLHNPLFVDRFLKTITKQPISKFNIYSGKSKRIQSL